ncbi:hypothetical protein Tco_0777726 [Tanacetum coccineum]
MELESTNSGPTAKLPILKLGEYEMWAIRIKQYFQIQDYALWEVIENGQYLMAKSMFAAIETRFGGNAATKKTLLKQQYENFSATSAESLDSIFNMLQKIVSRLAILGVIIAQEDLNLKFLSVTTCSGILISGLDEYSMRDLEHNSIERIGNNRSEVKQYDDLLAKLHQTEFKATTYKRGLDTVEAQLVTYRKNDVLFSEEVAVLKRKVGCKQYEINMLKTEFEKVKQEKDGIDFKINKFDKALKDLDQLLGIQITDKSKKGLRYSAVPPPHPLIYNRPNKLDMSYSGLDEFKEPEFKGYGPENSKQESNVVCENKSDNSKENLDKSLVKEQISQDKSSFVEGYEPNTSKSVSEVEPKKVRKNVGAPIIEGLDLRFCFQMRRIHDESKALGQPQYDVKDLLTVVCSRHTTCYIGLFFDFKAVLMGRLCCNLKDFGTCGG